MRSVAEYVHDDNMPAGWYDDGESDESDDSDDSDGSNGSNESNENGENRENGGETDEEDEEHDPETGFIIDTHGQRQQRQMSPIVGDLRQHIGT